MMTASSRRVDGPHGTTPRDAEAMHKMAAAAERGGSDENTPANGVVSKKQQSKKQPKVEPKQQSESDDAGDDDEDGDDADDDEDDDEGLKTKSSSSSSSSSKNRNSAKKESSNAEDDDDDDKKSSKKSRRELPPHTVAILKGWMLSPEHVKHPYPTDEDKQMLLKKTGINMKQLTNWFTNARKRIWKPMMRREHSRQLQTAMEYEKTARPREPFAGPGGAPPMAYREAPYPPRPAIRHSFDAGSLAPGGPPRDRMQYHHPYEGMPPPGYAMPPPPQQHPSYPPRVVRSVSESATGQEYDDYIDALRIRKRVHEMSPDSVEGDGSAAHADKRYRRTGMVSPRSLKILHDWVAAHTHMEFPAPADSDKLQLSRDTGLDVQQIELWFKSNVGRRGAPLQAPQPPPQQQQQQQQQHHQQHRQAPPSLPQHGHPAYRSIPSRDNPMYPPPPAYGERRSIPAQGNPMFPPRPVQQGGRMSIPGAGNPQFPPPPAARRESSDGFRPGMVPPPGYHVGAYPPPHHPGYEGGEPGGRPMRALSINSGQYAHAAGASGGMPPPNMPTPVGAPGGNPTGLPSLTGRPMLPGARPGPPMGQARDARSHTLDMGQFAESRSRRKMNFQDILASTSSGMPSPAVVMPRPLLAPPSSNGGGYDASRPANAENVYPTEMAAPYAQKLYEQQQRSAMAAAAVAATNGSEQPHATSSSRI